MIDPSNTVSANAIPSDDLGWQSFCDAVDGYDPVR